METTSSNSNKLTVYAKSKDTSQVLLLRHATSVANQLKKQLINRDADIAELAMYGTDPTNRDTPLAEKGVQETKEARSVANSLKVHTVFVSPLKRTLQTAYRLFKYHPDFSSIRFIVCPLIREKFGGINNLPSDTKEIIEEFAPKFPNLDISQLMDVKKSGEKKFKNLLKMMYKESRYASETLTPEQGNEAKLFKILKKKIAENYPMASETTENVLERAQKMKKLVAEYIRAEKLNEDPSKKVILISHSNFFCSYLGLEKTPEMRKLDKPLVPHCTFVSDPTDFTTI